MSLTKLLDVFNTQKHEKKSKVTNSKPEKQLHSYLSDCCLIVCICSVCSAGALHYKDLKNRSALFYPLGKFGPGYLIKPLINTHTKFIHTRRKSRYNTRSFNCFSCFFSSRDTVSNQTK